MDSKNLDEQSFVLGLEAKELPLEPEPLDRVAYNTGLRIYHGEKSVNDYYQMSIGMVGFFRLSKDHGGTLSDNARKGIQESVSKVDEKYQDFLTTLNSVPQFAQHTEALEKRVTGTYQTLKKEADSVLS